MNRDNQIKRKAVDKAYAELSKKLKNWPWKYNIGYQLSKMLCDYWLLSKVSLLDKRVLNIGCCEPLDEIFWANLVEEWHALDINEAVIKIARKLALEALPLQLYSKLKFIVGDATKLDLKDEYYDVVVSFSTIDHIPDNEGRLKAIKEMARVLKKGGYMIVTVPNRWDVIYTYRSRKLQKSGKAIFGFEYQFSPLELKRMLRSNGLRIIDCASTAFNPCSYSDKLLKKLKIPIVYFGTRFGYLAKKV